jgi:hypothetical protein
MTSKSNGQSRKEAGTKSRRYIWKIYLGLSFDDLCSLITFQKKHMQNDNDFDGDVYDNYTAKIF